MPLEWKANEEVPMYCFPMLSDAYADALLATDDGTPEPSENDAASVGSSETRNEDLVKAHAQEEEEDLETARTRPLRRDALHL